MKDAVKKEANERRRREFRECSVCAAKPGSPILCSSCLHNRTALELLREDKVEFGKMLQTWLSNDSVMAGYIWKVIEARDMAFVRGWRSAMYNVIQKLNDPSY